MSTLLKKLYPEPPAIQGQTVKEYYDNFAKAFRQLQDETGNEEAEGVPFFYVVDFQFSDMVAPMVWVGKLNAAWKNFYKQSRRGSDFAGGLVVKSTDLGKDSIPYKFIIEEGKGAKKGFMQAVRKEVKKQTSKNIEFILQAGDGEDNEMTEDLSKVESATSSVFERIRKATVQYKNIDATKTPLLKMEMRQQLDELFGLWDNQVKSSEKTKEQKAFVEEFRAAFSGGSTLYRDRAFEILGLTKKAEVEYRECLAEKKEALQIAANPDDDSQAQARTLFRDLFVEWMELQSDLNEILSKHHGYFDKGERYDSVPDDALQAQEAAKRNCKKMLQLLTAELEHAQNLFLKSGGTTQEIYTLSQPKTNQNLVLPELSENQHPVLLAQMKDYNEALKAFKEGGENDGEALQQKMLKINDWAFIQQAEWRGQIQKLRGAIGDAEEKLQELQMTSTTDVTEPKIQKAILVIQAKIKEWTEQLNEILGKQQELSAVQTQMYYARKELALTNKIDREYSFVLQAYERFNNHKNAYLSFVNEPPKLGAARRALPLIQEAQDAIDFLEARIQAWQESHNDLHRAEIKNKNKEVERMRSEIRAFATAKYNGLQQFSFQYSEGEYVPQPYVPEEDKLYIKNIRGLINGYQNAQNNMLDDLVHKSEKHQGSDEEKFFARRSEICKPRIKDLREALEYIGDWNISTKGYDSSSSRLKDRRKRCTNVEEGIHKELTVLQCLQEIDLVAQNANKVYKKRGEALEERNKLTNYYQKLVKADTTGFEPKKMEAFKKELIETTFKIDRNEALQYRYALTSVESMKATDSYWKRIGENLNDKGLIARLTQKEKLDSEQMGNDGKDFINQQVAGFEREFQNVLTSGKDGEELKEALHRLEQRISPFFIGLSRSTMDSELFDSQAPLKLQKLLETIQATLQDMEGEVRGMNTIAKAIVSNFNKIKDEPMTAKVLGELELLLQAVNDWEKQHAHRQTKRIQDWWDKLQPVRKDIQKQLEREDLEAFRRKLEVERALKQAKNLLDGAIATMNEQSKPLNEELTALSEDLIQRQSVLSALELRCEIVETLPDLNTLMGEVMTKVMAPARDAQKQLLLMEMQSPSVVEEERQTFAALGDGFDVYRNRGFVIPQEEENKIKQLGIKTTNRINKLLKLGLSPEELMPQLQHIPFTLLPDNLLPEMQAFKQVRRALMEGKMAEEDKELEDALESDVWTKMMKDLLDKAQTPEQLDTALKSLAAEQGSPLTEEMLDAIKSELQLDKDKTTEEWNKDVGTAKAIVEAINYVNKGVSMAAKQGEKLFGEIKAPVQPDNTGVPESDKLPETVAGQMAGVATGITSILGGVAKIIAQFEADTSRNPQQELNAMMHKYWNTCEAIFSIGLGATKIAAVFQHGLDGICGAFNVAKGIMKMADAITSLIEHKNMQDKTKSLQQRAAKDDNTLMYAFQQEVKNLELQIKGDAVAITSAALLTGSGVANIAGGPIGIAVGTGLKVASTVLENGWKAYVLKTKKSNIDKVTKLFSRVVQGDRDSVTELLASSAYFAKMLIVVRAQAGDDLALQYCLHRGIAPEDLDNEFYSKKILHDYLLEISGEKMGAIEKEILGDPLPKNKAESEEFKMPELEKSLAEKIKALPSKAKELYEGAVEKVVDIAKALPPLVDKVKDKVKEYLPKVQMALGATVGAEMSFLEEKEVVTLEEIIDVFEEYNKILSETAVESPIKAAFSSIMPKNQLKALRQTLGEYKTKNEELYAQLGRELREAGKEDGHKALEMSQSHSRQMSELQQKLMLIRVIDNMYPMFGL